LAGSASERPESGKLDSLDIGLGAEHLAAHGKSIDIRQLFSN
jgi:hypothetical protein